MKGSGRFLFFAGAVVVLYAAFCLARLQRYENNLTAFVGFGCLHGQAVHLGVCWAKDNRTLLPERTIVYTTGGYDGQFYYYIAAGLWRAEPVRLDAPPLRYSRIGYPLLAAPFYATGGRGLILALLLVPLSLHLLTLYLLHVLLQKRARAAEKTALPGHAFALGLFALNPLSLHATGLALADGLALSLGLSGVIVHALSGAATDSRSRAGRACAFALIVGACLTKETMLALPLGFAAAALLRRDLGVVAYFLGTLAPVVGYWYWIGFSPGMAADRGGLPFAGFLEFLATGEGLAGGRGFLAVLLFLYSMTGLYLFAIAWRRGITVVADREAFHGPGPLELAGVLGASVALISFATADEYWANFANISRFFIPGLLPLSLLPLIPGRGVSQGRIVAVLFGFLGLFTLSLLYAELRAGALPYVLYP